MPKKAEMHMDKTGAYVGFGWLCRIYPCMDKTLVGFVGIYSLTLVGFVGKSVHP